MPSNGSNKAFTEIRELLEDEKSTIDQRTRDRLMLALMADVFERVLAIEIIVKPIAMKDKVYSWLGILVAGALASSIFGLLWAILTHSFQFP